MALSFVKMKSAVDIVLKSGHVPNIIGLQGVGKSDLVREYAKENKYAFAEVTCSLLQEGDLAMPYLSSNDDGSSVEYAISNIITSLHREMEKRHVKGVLFLDEFNRGSTKVQSEMMNLVLQREIVGYRLDKDVMVVIAMNPSSEMQGYEDTNYSVSFSDSAILGRVCSLHLQPVLSDWLLYGEKLGISGNPIVHPVVRGYLTVNSSYFITKEAEGRINNTPRGWKQASDILYSYDESGISNKDLLRNLFEGCLDSDCVPSFLSYVLSKGKSKVNYGKLAEQVLSGKYDYVKNSLSDVALDSLFNVLIQKIYEIGDVPTDVENRFVDYIMSANNALSYSWVELMSREHKDLYEALVMDSKTFSNYVLSVLSNISEREKGGFSGK